MKVAYLGCLALGIPVTAVGLYMVLYPILMVPTSPFLGNTDYDYNEMLSQLAGIMILIVGIGLAGVGARAFGDVSYRPYYMNWLTGHFGAIDWPVRPLRRGRRSGQRQQEKSVTSPQDRSELSDQDQALDWDKARDESV